MLRPALLLLAAALAGPSSSPARPPDEVAVNRFATVRSADGHANLRHAPTASGATLGGRLANGRRVLVRTCQAGRAGRRWCEVQAADVGPGAGRYMHESGLAYEAARARGTVAGAGVAPGFRAVLGEGLVQSADGYVNLRSAPSSRTGAVLGRVASGELVGVLACQAGRRPGARWCLVEADLGAPAFPPRLGYVHDGEVPIEEGHDH